MQRAIVAAGVAALVLVTSACAGENSVRNAMPGSYATVPLNDDHVVSAARFAIDAQRKAMSVAGDRPALELVSILAAEQQVVSGINYRLRLRVTHNGAQETAEAVIWWQAWRQPNPYQLSSWEWK